VRFRIPDFDTAVGKILVLALVGVRHLNALHHVGVAIRDRAPFQETQVDDERRIAPHRIVEQRMRAVIHAAGVRAVLHEFEVPALEPVFTEFILGDLLLERGRDLVVVALTAEHQLVEAAVVGLLERTGREFVELTGRDRRTGQLDNTLVGVGFPVGFGGHRSGTGTIVDFARNATDSVARVAEFPLFQEPQQATGEIPLNGFTSVRIGRVRVTAFAKQRSLFQTGQMVDAVVLQRFLVMPRLVVGRWRLESVAGQLERVLVNLRAVRNLDRILVAARAGPGPFGKGRTHEEHALTFVVGGVVQDRARQRIGRFELDVVGTSRVGCSDTAEQVAVARSEHKVPEADGIVNLEVARVVDVSAIARAGSRSDRSARRCGRSAKIEHHVSRGLTSGGREGFDLRVAFFLPAEHGNRSALRFHEGQQRR